jgi:hypothetical protein
MAAIAETSAAGSSTLPPPNYSTKAIVPSRYQICGRFVHPNGEPLRFKLVRVNGGFFSSEQEFFTDSDGRFMHYAKPFKPLFGSSTTLSYKIFEQNVFYNAKNGCAERVQVCSIKQKVSIEKQGRQVGDIVARVYEYKKDFPDLQQPEKAKYRPQQWPYTWNLIVGAYDEIIKDIYAKKGGFHTIQAVQAAYKTAFPDLEVTAENTIDMILNGIYGAHFLKGPGNNLYVKINWDQYPKKDRPLLPNVEMTLTYENEKLEIIEIVTQINGTLKPYHKDAPDFRDGLYLFNCAAVLKGEIETHLTRCHFFSGQLAMAVFRSLSDGNPIKKLLAGHLKGVLEINRMATDVLAVLARSGLTMEGVMNLIKHNLGAMCYSTFTPRKPMTPGHWAAQSSQLYWQIVQKVVNEYIQNNEAEIRTHWNEIYAMSHNLVTNSAPYHPYDGVENHELWFDPEEIDNPNVPGRVTWDGILRSMRPVTLNPNEPDQGDLGRLAQLCCVAMHNPTIEHENRHDSQPKWVSNLNYASIAPNGDGTGVMGGTEIDDGAAQLSLIHKLTDFKSDPLVENQYGDVYQPLIDELLAHREEFAKLGVDITEMSYGIVI